MDEFLDKVVLLTGATSGIGKEAALAFAIAGAKVAVNYHSDDEKKERTQKEIEALLSSQGRSAKDLLMINADVSRFDSVAEMFAAVADHFGHLDCLVNNAGMESETPSHELDEKTIETQLGVNLNGPLYCCIHAIRHFLKNGGGSIVNVSSVHEKIPKPGFLPYSVSKGAMGNLTRTLALEYADHNIRVNGIGPGVVDTPMNDQLEDEQVRETVKSHIPNGTIITPKEVAEAILFLASERMAHLIGQTLYLDGGLTLYPDFKDNWSS